MTTRPDPAHYKPRLRAYLTAKGVRTENGKYQCPSPDHPDETPSAHLYDDNRLYCPVCEATMDIFDVAGMLTGAASFPDRMREVQSTLGEAPDEPAPRKKTPASHVPVTVEQARTIYTRSRIAELGAYITKRPAEIAGSWPYLSVDGETVHMVDVRFEWADTDTGETDKTVISFYYDGNHVRAKNPPVLLYGLETLPGATAVMFHEGAKSAKAARAIDGWAHLAWNGGGKKSRLVDLAPLVAWYADNPETPVYLYPDDDNKTDRNGAEKPRDKQPGYQAMADLRDRLHAHGIASRIVDPYPEARTVKSDGADIVEALEVADAETLRAWISREPEPDAPTTTDTEPAVSPTDGWLFRILGRDDKGYGHYISTDGTDGVAVALKLDSLSKTKLLMLADIEFWRYDYGLKSGVDWDQAISDLIRCSADDYDPDKVRGRGAWREDGPDGTCYVYHDGKRQWRNPDGCGGDPSYIYMPGRRVDIGLGSEPADAATRREIFDVAATLPWESKADCVRVLSWAALSPFCGALPWRPAGILTGPSGSGKSTVSDYIVRPIASPLSLIGGESTEAGIRQSTGLDARNVLLDEAEADTEPKKRNRDGTFSLMRQSTTDDTPHVVKGTTSGAAMNFTMRNMYLFIAIDPEIDSIADENRMFRANLITHQEREEREGPDAEPWPEKAARIKRLINSDTCAGIRSHTWRKLPEILADVSRLSRLITEATRKDIRWATAEAILLSTYFVVWRDKTPTDDEARDVIGRFYEAAPPDEQRDETAETLDRLFNESVPVSSGRGEWRTLRSIVHILAMREVENENDGFEMRPATRAEMTRYKTTLNMYGISVMRDGNVAVRINHHKIQHIIRSGAGYHHRLKRHPGCVGIKNVTIDRKQGQALVFELGSVVSSESDEPLPDELPI